MGEQVEDRCSVWRVGDEHVCVGELGCEEKEECVEDCDGGDAAACAAECEGDVSGEEVEEDEVRLWLYDDAMWLFCAA